MFCRNCGNQLADNAKFCGKCGSPVVQKTQPAAEQPAPEPVTESVIVSSEPQPAPRNDQYQQPAPQPQPIPEPEPAPIPQPTPIPQQFEQNYQQPNVQQPYVQQPYPQQPVAQPFPQQQAVPQPSSSSGKIVGFVMMLCCIFFVCTFFIKCYTIIDSDFSVYTYLDRIAEAAEDRDIGFFKYYFSDLIGDSAWYGAAFYICILLNILFDVLAVIMLIFGFVRLASSDRMSEVKMWTDIKVSVLFSFLGTLSMFVGVFIANVFDNLKNDLGIFEEWGCIPGVLVYVFLAAEIAVIFICGLMKRKAVRSVSVNTPAYAVPPVSPIPPQFRQ